MIEIRRTDDYDDWFRKLRDRQARARILIRINRLALGNPGDVRPVGGGVSELRIDYGPGWRVYVRFVDGETAVLLTGGDKSTQQRDIERARALARALAKGADR
ncbi:MAG: type II toxin-antitoxin system RelE/ParE family toxin [Rhodospirillales bacterium]|nr:type II toxin-antitoxin system RelE/ParE family toxin [Rhodospirillales bacterium]MDE0378129.1 type II toxin-antitoxin system RelE/ParE family toxin [Rhodospirillales bacterium]